MRNGLSPLILLILAAIIGCSDSKPVGPGGSGKLVATVTDGIYDPGHHTVTWHQTDDSGELVDAGYYEAWTYIIRTPYSVSTSYTEFGIVEGLRTTVAPRNADQSGLRQQSTLSPDTPPIRTYERGEDIEFSFTVPTATRVVVAVWRID